MTYYNPHPAHVLVGDAVLESRKKLVRDLYNEKDYCERWDLARALVDKYTEREVDALADVILGYVNIFDTDGKPEFDLPDLCDILADRLARDYTCSHISPDILTNPDSRLPTSDIHGEEDQHGRV